MNRDWFAKVIEMGCCGGSSRSNNNEERVEKNNAGSNDESLRILNVRLAKGEITKQQYDEMRASITQGSGGTYQSQTTDGTEEKKGKKRWFSGGGC